MNQILKINCTSISSLCFFGLLFMVSSTTTVFAQSTLLNAKIPTDTTTYLNAPLSDTDNKLLNLKELSLKEVEELENQIFREISYCKFEYYLHNVEKGKNRYSLASISDKKLKSIMDIAPNDEIYAKNWKMAVQEYTDFENTNSKEIKEHRKNYRVNFNTKIERDAYYEKYWKLSKDLKREKFEEYAKYQNNLVNKLNVMWLNRGWYLLNFYKSKKLLFPIECINWQEYEGIEYDERYSKLTENMETVEKRIRRLR